MTTLAPEEAPSLNTGITYLADTCAWTVTAGPRVIGTVHWLRPNTFTASVVVGGTDPGIGHFPNVAAALDAIIRIATHLRPAP